MPTRFRRAIPTTLSEAVVEAARGCVTLFVVTSAGCLLLETHPAPWPCQSSDDCRSGETCRSLGDGRFGCAEVGACSLSVPCESSARCVNERCVPKQCQDNLDCGAYRCNVGTTYTCLTACSVGAGDCNYPYTCQDGACSEPECRGSGSTECGGFACQSGVCNHQCGEGTTTGCAPGFTCQAGGCAATTGAAGAAGAGSGTGGAGGAGGKAGAAGASAGAGGVGAAAGKGGSPGACDPIAQTGCKTPKTKCTLPPSSEWVACVTPAGERMVGEPCSSADPKTDCVPGAYCSSIGVVTASPSRYCRSFCRTADQCGAAEFCAEVTSDPYGVCIQGCDPWQACGDPSSSTCAGRWNDNEGTQAHLACRLLGKTPEDGSCVRDDNCQADMLCDKGHCVYLCDQDHPCNQGWVCTEDGKPCPAGHLCLCQ